MRRRVFSVMSRWWFSILGAFALLGPAVEFLLQALVGGWGFFVRHKGQISVARSQVAQPPPSE